MRSPGNVWGFSQGVGDYFGGLGDFAGKELVQAGAHGLTQGGVSLSTGGNFWQGFGSGAVGSLSGSWTGGMDSYGARLAVSAVAGGTASAITGGSFADGAVTGAYVTMFNHFAHQWRMNNLQRKAEKFFNELIQQEGGGRLFENEGDAYRFMWENSFDANGNVSNEVAAFLTPDGVLVLPTEGRRTNGEYARNGSRTSYNDFLPLSRKGGNLYVTFDGNRIQVLGQVHTHPNIQPFENYEVAPDLGVQSFLGVPINIMRTNGFYNLNSMFLGTRQEFFNGTKSLFRR